MMDEQSQSFFAEIKEISSHFEHEPWTDNQRYLKENFDIKSIKTPSEYLDVMSNIEELYRQSRILFLFSVLDRVCKEEGKNYSFETPYQAGMRYDSVMRKDGTFYLLDEDGHYRDIFTSEPFTRFIEDTFYDYYTIPEN